jgi:hypothetical protein
MSNELDPFGGYRVGDAERARTVDLLKEAHVAGYLDLSEIDERLSAALAAKTHSDLDKLVADLPPDWRARQAGEPATPAPRRRARDVAPLLGLAVPVLVTVAIAALVVLSISRGFFFPWPLLWIFLIFGRHHRRGGRGGGGWDGRRDDRRTTWV